MNLFTVGRLLSARTILRWFGAINGATDVLALLEGSSERAIGDENGACRISFALLESTACIKFKMRKREARDSIRNRIGR